MITPAPVIAFAHNWESNPVETLIWKTDIIENRDGSEQRRELRENPRETLTYAISMTDARDAAQLGRLLWSTPNLRIALPRWEDAMMVNVNALVGDTTVVVDAPAGARRFVGDALLFIEGEAVERITISDVTVDTMTLVTPLLAAWPAGTTVVPLVTGYVQPKVDGSDSSNNQMDFSLTIEIEEDVAGVTDGGELQLMVPASIAVYPHAPGSEGVLSFYDIQGLVAEVRDAAGTLIPDADVEFFPPAGPGVVQVYPTGTPGVYNVKNLRTSGAGPITVPITVTAGAVVATYSMLVQ